MNKKTIKAVSVVAGLMTVVFIIVLIMGLGSEPAPVSTPDEVPAESSAETTVEPPIGATDDNSVTLSFIGDCILGSDSGKSNEGNFTWTAENKDHSYFFSEVYDVLSKDDLTLANCEVVLSDRELTKTPKDYSPAFWFIAPSINADILKLGSVEVAGVVNNHTNDYGEEGYKDTVAALKAQDIAVGESLQPLYFEKNGIKIGVLYCNLWAEYQVQYIRNALETMQEECDYKIVFFHGGTEAVHEPDNYKIDACRYLAESGLCDLIIGSHPHVLQPMEVINGVPIVYSLGNFCYSANNYPENKTIIFQALLTIDGEDIHTATRIIPCYVYTGYRNNWQPAIVTDEDDKAEIMAMMEAKVEYQTEPSSTTEPTTTKAPETEPATEYVQELPPDPTENTQTATQSETVIMMY